MQVKTINLTGEETEINSGKEFVFAEINNSSDSEILVSASPDIVRGNDNVMIISSKTIGTLGDVGFPRMKKIYAKGTGEIQVIGKDFAEHCFKLPASGDGSDVKPTPEVLDFLPHPEGIYAYWDWEHGVENFTWTDMVNGTELKAVNGSNFSVENSSVHLNGGSSTEIGVELPIKNPNAFTIYMLSPFMENTIYILDSENNFLKTEVTDNWSISMFFYNKGSRSTEVMKRDRYGTYQYFTSALLNSITNFKAITRMMPRFENDLKTLEVSMSYRFNEIVGLPGMGGAYSAILLSDDISNIDNIKENVLALQQLYYPI